MTGRFTLLHAPLRTLAGIGALAITLALGASCASPAATAPDMVPVTASPSAVPVTASPMIPLPPATATIPSPFPPSPGSPSASPVPAPTGERAFATRVRIPLLQIDLPIVPGDLDVPGNLNDYPLCDVAMYLPEFVQPGEPGTTYLYAHAQRGMFLPLLTASETDDGAALIGALVEVFTSADEVHVYEIVVVKRHATDFSLATDAGDAEQLLLQTSEGPTGTVPKLQVAARPVSVSRAAPSEAQPEPQPRVCLPGGG
jgi:hypothetical protein